MTHQRLLTLRALALFVVVSLSYPVVVDAGQAGRGKSSRVSAKSGRSRSASPRHTTSRRHAAPARRATSHRRTSSRRSTAAPRGRRTNSGRSSARINRTHAGQSGRSRKSSVSRRSPSRNVTRRPAPHTSPTGVRAPSSSSRGQRRQITPRRVIRNINGNSTGRSSRSTNRGLRNSVVARDTRSTVSRPRHSGSSVIVNDSGRTRSNFNNEGRTFSRLSNGRRASTSGTIALDNNTSSGRDRSSAGRHDSRRFNSGHGAVGAPFAGSVFINENVSRYGRAHDRDSGFRDNQHSRSVRLHPSESNGHHGGYSRGHGSHYGHDSYRHAYSNHAYFDNAYYYGAHYYGRRHHNYYDTVYYPTYGYYGYGYGYPYSYPSTYPFTYPYTSVDVYTQPYYEVDPAIEQVYEDAVSASATDPAYLPPAPSSGTTAVPSAPLAAPQAGTNQPLPQVEQVHIPQSVVDGHQAFARHDVAKAQHAYLTAVLADNEDGYAKLFYAMASVSAEEYDVASLALRGALSQASELVTEPIDLRQFYNDADQAATDLKALTAFSSAHDDDIDAQFLLAYFYYSMGQADDAQRVLMSVDGSAYEKDAIMKELRDAVSAVISRSQDKP